MKMPNITPGPWKADQATIQAPDAKVSIACVLDIAWPYGIKPSDPEANATAIAALPDLIAALIEADRILDMEEFAEDGLARRPIRAALFKAGCTDA